MNDKIARFWIHGNRVVATGLGFAKLRSIELLRFMRFDSTTIMKGILWVMRVRALPVVLILLFGCGPDGGGFALFPRSSSAHETHDQEAKGHEVRSPFPMTPDSGIEVIRLGFEIRWVRMPVRGIRHSRKVWNHVDPLRVESAAAARLARNGIGVGVATIDAWPALNAIFEVAEASLLSEQLQAQPGLPIELPISEIRGSQSVFSYSEKGRLVGKTFREGEKVVGIDYAYHPEFGGTTDLRIGFGVRRQKDVVRWQPDPGSMQPGAEVERYTFENLHAFAALAPGEFVVVGPSPDTSNEYLVGARFFSDEVSGQAYEILLLISPRVYRNSVSDRR